MFLKKTTCLLLTLVLICTIAGPVFADGNPPPPPVPGGDNIHPWDNNDEYGSWGGPLLSRHVIVITYGFSGRLITIPLWNVGGLMKSDRSGSDNVLRQGVGSLQVVTRNR
jgi:hypothetical protein